MGNWTQSGQQLGYTSPASSMLISVNGSRQSSPGAPEAGARSAAPLGAGRLPRRRMWTLILPTPIVRSPRRGAGSTGAPIMPRGRRGGGRPRRGG